MNKEEIVFLTNSLEVGGCERHLATVLPELNKKYTLRLIVWGPEKGKLASEVEAQGVLVETLLKRPFWQKYKPLLRPLSLIARVGVLAFRLRRLSPRVIHFFLPAPYIVGMLAVRLSGVSVLPIMSRRSLNFYQQGGRGWIEKFWHKFIFRATGNSQRVCQELQEEGIPPQKIRLIYNGVGVEKFSRPDLRAPTRSSLGFSAQEVVILHLANLIPYKGHQDLLQALALIDPRLPFTVLCVGRDHNLQASLQAQAQELGISPRIHWLGPRQDVPALLSASDISVLCSHHEGFSNSILESMAAGLPVVATDVGGNPEAVLHEETGLLVPPYAPALLGQALERLICSPMLRQKWGEAAKKRACQEFSVSACLQKYIALYQEAL